MSQVTIQLLAFGDETGTEQGAIWLIVGGYLTSPRRWKHFDRSWNQMLNAELGGAPFHARDLFQKAAWQSRSSPYHGWGDDDALRFLRGLITLIGRYDLRPVGGCVSLPDWETFSPEARRYFTGANLRTTLRNGQLRRDVVGSGAPLRAPYMAALALMKWQVMRNVPTGAVVDFVLDKNTANERLAQDVFDRSRVAEPAIGRIEFAEDQLHPGLQAADLYCYVWNMVANGKAPTRLHQAARDWFHGTRDPWVLDKKLARDHLEYLDTKQAKRIREEIVRHLGGISTQR